MDFHFPINLTGEPPTDNHMQSLLISARENLQKAQSNWNRRMLSLATIVIAVCLGMSLRDTNPLFLVSVILMGLFFTIFALVSFYEDLERARHLATATEYSLKIMDNDDAIVIAELIARDPVLMAYAKKVAKQGRILVQEEAIAMKKWEDERPVRDAMEKLKPENVLQLQ